jgi:2-succinyl-5-enolpyruvyl-6-hydroxy-3-cyclohexene-1-carboxylate synthase
MTKHYTDEGAAQVVLALLKAHGIRKVIASPGTTNMALVNSMQSDSYFEMYSSVDERSAAYIACGLASESGEPVVISCTGATASRNYLSGLTEAFYRKLPVLAITSTPAVSAVGHHIAQVIDRSTMPKDAVRLSVTLPVVKDHNDLWECEIKVNQAILELKRRGGGPAHINLPTTYKDSFETKVLPKVRVINRIVAGDSFPEFPRGKVAVFVGAHAVMSKAETAAIDAFCESNDAVVFCDHTSGYRGKYRVLYSAVASQRRLDFSNHRPDLLIHIGEVSGDYSIMNMVGKEVWRISPDGEIRDTFRKLRYVFEMPHQQFFEHYANSGANRSGHYLKFCKDQLAELYSKIPELPFSNPWIASKMAHRIPNDSVIHFGILNSLRSWNFFELPQSVESACNVGGFGIDGCMSALLGASLANKSKLHFGVIGDLSTFYDMNALGNRHLGKNLRILLVNNGKGTEFRNSSHRAAVFGNDADEYVAAAGHFGNKSSQLIKHYAHDLGFEYLCASNKNEFESVFEHFLTAEITDRPILFEVFTESIEESDALELLMSVVKDEKVSARGVAKKMLGEKGVKVLKKATGR